MMIADAAQSVILSTLPWADRGNLAVIRTADESAQMVPVSERLNLELVRGRDDHFAIVHANANVTVHHFGEPARAIATLQLDGLTARIRGDAAAFANVPQHYVVMTERDFALLSIRDGAPVVERFPWYDDSYDKGYQGLIAATEVPGSALLAIAVQRDSDIVLYDPVKREVVRKVPLAERRGNPQLWFRDKAPELWASDLDTLLKLDATTFAPIDAQQLQPENDRGVRQFVGAFAFDADEAMIAVARPFSDDVAGIDPATLRMTHTCSTGDKSQPIEALVLRDGRVFARGWKGAILRGSMKQRPFYRFFR